jgi:hypothetical protein
MVGFLMRRVGRHATFIILGMICLILRRVVRLRAG